MDKYLIAEKFGHRIYFGTGSSTGYPGYHGMQTADLKDWMKIDDSNWFRPYVQFDKKQILSIIDICKTEFQLVDFMFILSIKDSDIE